MTAQVQQTADGGHCGRRWAPVNPVTNDGSCAQVLLSKDGGQSYSLAYIAQNEWSGSARLPGLLGELLPPKKTHNRATTAAAPRPAVLSNAGGSGSNSSGAGGGGWRSKQCVADPQNNTFWDHTKCSSGNGTNACCTTDWSSTSAEECCETCPGKFKSLPKEQFSARPTAYTFYCAKC